MSHTPTGFDDAWRHETAACVDLQIYFAMCERSWNVVIAKVMILI